jgi:hypothetical protein
MKISAKKSALAAFLVSLAVACGSTTDVTGSYKSPEMTANGLQYKKIFIAALTSNVAMRQKVEASLAQSITASGYSAVKSIDVFTPDFQSNAGGKSDLLLQKIQETGSDAILTIALIDKATETRYVPGSSYPVYSHSYYGSFGGYYGNYYGTMYDPGYYTTDKTYFLETNLYDLASEKIVWSAQSETMNPSDIDDFMTGYKKAIQKQLVKDGLVKEKK